MSLMNTLAKVAIGVAVAKGMKKMMRGGQAQQQPSQGGLGSILGQLAKGGGKAGGLGGLLGGLTGGGAQGSSSLDGMLGSVLGGKTNQSNGGLGGLLDSLGSGNKGGFGERVNQSIENFGQTEQTANSDDEQTAKVMLAAMIQAAKADGEIDESEKAAITKNLGSISEEDMAFINQQIQSPLNPEGLAQAVPNGMQQQAYAMSLLAIDLDNKKEAEFLDKFAKSLSLDANSVNAIHSQMGEPALYS